MVGSKTVEAFSFSKTTYFSREDLKTILVSDFSFFSGKKELLREIYE